MPRIAYIMLCHRDPEGAVAMARVLVAGGDAVAIHFDASAPRTDWQRLCAAVVDLPQVTLVRPRRRCGWGEWSLVAATLDALRTARAAFPDATHFYMMSGDCAPIKTAQHIHDVLGAQACDWIESVDFFEGDWIRTGMKEDRLIYRHLFNERRQRRLFYLSHALQKRLRLTRKPPADLRIRIGSQWWCLRRGTIDAILDLCATRPDIVRFFSTTWIPDETFFQTMVRHIVPDEQVRSRSPTFLMFTDYGLPVVFHDDHHDMLLAQGDLFARKISPDATTLRARLARLYTTQGVAFQVSDTGRRQFDYLTTRGRVGLRDAPRFWEAAATVGRDRTLLLIACKKWHVAKRLLTALEQVSPLPGIGFLFHEADTPLPDLGGLERGLNKRHRHRRALVRMLFDFHRTDRLAICVDPSDIAVIADFHADRCETRLLEIVCAFSDADLAGHAQRAGLVAPATDPKDMTHLLPCLRHDLRAESDRIAEAGLDGLQRISHSAGETAQARALAAFFDLSQEDALRVARSAGLFDD